MITSKEIKQKADATRENLKENVIIAQNKAINYCEHCQREAPGNSI